MITPSQLPHLDACRGLASSGGSAAADRGWAIDDLMSAIAAGESPEIPEEYADQVAFGREVLTQLDGSMIPQHSVVCFQDSFLCGTADLVALGRIPVVLDWKTGWGDRPPADKNLQLMAYGCGVMTEHQLQACELWLVELDKRTISKAVLNAADIPAIEDRVNRLISEAGREPFTPCSSCKYCKRRETCPALSREVAEVAEVSSAGLTDAEVGAFLDKWLEKVEVVASLVDQVKGRAISIIAAGGTVPGWTCKQGRKTRKWKEAPAEAMEQVPMSVAQYEKKIGKAPADMVIESRGNPQLVKEKKDA